MTKEELLFAWQVAAKEKLIPKELYDAHARNIMACEQKIMPIIYSDLINTLILRDGLNTKLLNLLEHFKDQGRTVRIVSAGNSESDLELNNTYSQILAEQGVSEDFLPILSKSSNQVIRELNGLQTHSQVAEVLFDDTPFTRQHHASIILPHELHFN